MLVRASKLNFQSKRRARGVRKLIFIHSLFAVTGVTGMEINMKQLVISCF
jgi:hypothetical protein